MNKSVKLIIIGVWLLAFIFSYLMKKIQPESFKPYLIYVTVISLIFTLFQVWLNKG